jgi:exopolysaccharide biosynthesis polyprenyl glycosylphosphotransferase
VDLIAEREIGYLPSILIGAVALPSLLYIFGFYASNQLRRHWRKDLIMLLAVLGITSLLVMAAGSVFLSARVGRGVMGIGIAITAVIILLRHLGLSRVGGGQRTAFIVTSARDEALASTFCKAMPRWEILVGVFSTPDYKLAGALPHLGNTDTLEAQVQSGDIQCVMCDEGVLDKPELAAKLRGLRFHGVTISTLLHAFEDQYQFVPLELVNERWLLDASSQPRMFYLRKVKRAFDVVVAFTMLVLLAPLCALVALAVAMTSKGPIIYRQVRSGKSGRPFKVFKFRSMKVDAEADGKARWWSSNDPRETLIGRFLRKFRIDEIPQLVNILRGEMSFVGPRPERPEFVEELSQVVPYYQERLVMLPGLTGWAQVNYPYGSCAQDAARKLEFDLYYMKHMSLVLDLFILLDTMRTVLRGGATARETRRESLHGLKAVEASYAPTADAA